MNNWLTIIQRWLYPPTCILCGDPGHADLDLCEACRRSLPERAFTCRQCGEAVAGEIELTCGSCLRHPPHFDATTAPFGYEEPVRHLILGLKFQRRYAYGRLLGMLLTNHLAGRADLPECIIPVPLHAARYRERGFNHAAEIARVVAAQIGVPTELNAARRVRRTRPQVGLDASQRRLNLRGAFELELKRPRQHVAILDDVVTTGATVDELARLLKRAGVARVEVWACARADRARYHA